MKEALRMPDMMNEQTKVVVIGTESENYRNTQPVNDRPVFFYDRKVYCAENAFDEKPKIQPVRGHYEKVKSKDFMYMFVKGRDASGLPDSYVVSEKEAMGKAQGEETEEKKDA